MLDKGYDVYLPVVDDNGVDLIVMNNDRVKKIQVKTHSYANGTANSIEVNTRRLYNADILAVPIVPKDSICYLKTPISKRAITIAYEDSLNGQKLKRNWYEDYLEFPWD